MKNRFLIIAAGAVLGTLLILSAQGAWKKLRTHENHDHASEDSGQQTEYTCSMHPQIRSSHPGDCPLCGMALVPVASLGKKTPGGNSVYIASEDVSRIRLRTAVVQNGSLIRKLELQGRVAFDERTAWSMTAPFAGRVDWLKELYPGARLQAGQEVARLWSPEIAGLLVDLKHSAEVNGEDSPLVRSQLRQLAARYTLDTNRWKSLDPEKGIPLRTARSGIVLEKNVNPGDYVQTGAPLLNLAGSGSYWALLDVFENDLPWIRPGQTVVLRSPALPGKNIKATVESVDPFLDPVRTTATVRIALPSSSTLRPGASLYATVEAEHQAEKMPVIPASAVLWTGKRSIVWVRDTSHEGYAFQLRQVVLGPALGDSYAIEEGLQVGEEIAVAGAFAIDAAAQLAGNPSMLNQPEPVVRREVSAGLPADQGLAAYLRLKDALVQGNSDAAAAELGKLWPEESASKDLEKQRALLSDLYPMALNWAKETGKPVYVQFCPMAFQSTGGYWLSQQSEIRNPYYGEAMLTCGELRDSVGL